MDDFLIKGGIELEDQCDNDSSKDNKDTSHFDSLEDPLVSYNTDSDEKMSGYLVKSSVKLAAGAGGSNEDILGMVVGSIGDGMKMGFKMFTETIKIK